MFGVGCGRGGGLRWRTGEFWSVKFPVPLCTYFYTYFFFIFFCFPSISLSILGDTDPHFLYSFSLGLIRVALPVSVHLFWNVHTNVLSLITLVLPLVQYANLNWQARSWKHRLNTHCGDKGGLSIQSKAGIYSWCVPTSKKVTAAFEKEKEHVLLQNIGYQKGSFEDAIEHFNPNLLIIWSKKFNLMILL